MQGLTDWTAESCRDLIAEWMKIYSGVAQFILAVKAEARRARMVRDAWGMIRYLPAIASKDRSRVAEAERQAVSHIIQGGAQGMIQKSMIWLDRKLVQRALALPWRAPVQWRLQIHDEIVLSFSPEDWSEVDLLAREALTAHYGPVIKVPVECSGSMSETWAGLK